MKKTMVFCSLATLFSLSGAAALLDGFVSADWNETNRLVTVRYQLSAAAIVTVDIQTNRTGAATPDEADWVSIGSKSFRTVSGKINKLVASTAPELVFWEPDADFPCQNLAGGAMRALVTAWSTDDPPPYMVVDLVNADTRAYYLDADAIPGGVDDNAYRTTKMVMRRIPAKNVVWTMGAPSAQRVDSATNCQQHKVKLTDDYYMAIYPLTIDQATNPGLASKYWVTKDGRTYINDVYLNDGTETIRCFQCNISFVGEPAFSPVAEVQNRMRFFRCDDEQGWPGGKHYVKPLRFLGRLRTLTGVDFDLPTEAQWEFAARGGVGTMTPAGDFSNQAEASATLYPYAWVKNNCEAVGAMEVGKRLPNAFGLYDMLGNLNEMCLDWYADDYGGVAESEVATRIWENPVGAPSGAKRTLRGGACPAENFDGGNKLRKGNHSSWFGCGGYFASRTDEPYGQFATVRLMCPVGLAYPVSEKTEPSAD